MDPRNPSSSYTVQTSQGMTAMAVHSKAHIFAWLVIKKLLACILFKASNLFTFSCVVDQLVSTSTSTIKKVNYVRQ